MHIDKTNLTFEHKETLLSLAREAISNALQGQSSPIDYKNLPPRLQNKEATFVTLTIMGKLRGCIGTLLAHRPLALDVAENARAAAFEDPRFPPLAKEELSLLKIEISVLSQPAALSYEDTEDLLEKLHPGVDGVVLENGFHRATFLPQVWEQLPAPKEFLTNLCYKAGLPVNAWRWPETKISIYHVEKFKEAD